MKKVIPIIVIFLLSFTGLFSQCVTPPDSAFVTVITAHCNNSDGKITIDSIRSGTPPFTYSLNGGASQASNIFAAIQQGNYNLKVTDGSGCIYNYPVTIVVPKTYGPQPSTTLVTPVSGCNLNDGDVKVTENAAGSPYLYSLNGATGVASNTFTGLAAGTYYVKVTDTFGCDTTFNFFVAQPSGITSAGAVTTNADCGLQNGTITSTVFTGTAAVSDSVSNHPVQSSLTYTALAGNTLYNSVLTDANGCRYTIFNIWIEENPGPTDFTVTTVDENCNKADGEIHISNPVGGIAPYTYSVNSGTFTTQTNYTGLSSGSYTVTIKDVNGCRFDQTITITENNGPTSATITPVNPNCSASNGSITVTNITGGVSPYNTTISGGNFTNLPEGSYDVVITDNEGCSYNPPPVILTEQNQITALNLSVTDVICASAFGQIEVNGVSGGIAPYTFKLNGSVKSPPFTGLPIGNYTIDVTDVNGCTYQTTVAVGIQVSLYCSTTSSNNGAEITTGESVTITGEGNGTTNVWSGVSDNTNTSPTVTPAVTTTYEFTTSSQEGCESKCNITVTVIPKIYPYTGFSPNGDNKNDTWEIGYIQKYPKAEVSVYTRWGQRVFHAKEGYEGEDVWDGTNKGFSLPVASYYYVIKLNVENLPDPKSDEFHGFVTIIK